MTFLHSIYQDLVYIKHWLLLLAFSVWEYWLGKTTKLIASSSWELIALGVKRLFGRIEMKQLLNVGNGALVLNEEGGSLSLEFNESLLVGGGEAAGIISIKGSGSVVLSGRQGLHLLLKAIEAHSPAALVPMEQAAEAIIDSAIAKA